MKEGNISFILIPAICSFPRKIKIVIYILKAVPNASKGLGGTKAAMDPI